MNSQTWKISPITIVLSLILFIFCSIFVFKQFFVHKSISPKGMVWIVGGDFMMGSNSKYAKESEQPVHKVHVDGFWMDETDVTNAQFAAFVEATGYVTTAERVRDWENPRIPVTLNHAKFDENEVAPGSMVFIGTKEAVPLDDWSRWWRFIPGANWRHPQGPGSNILGKEDHPVVQVSYEDALAYAHWVGKRLPTEAEWEFAARGGLSEKNYNWGDEFHPQGRIMANIFAGDKFPIVEDSYRNKIGTTKVGSYPANGYGLYDMAGNVWQWVYDWYRVDAFKLAAQDPMAVNPKGPSESYDPDDKDTVANAPKKVIRGGSFLCDPNFCMSYRPSARRGINPVNPMSNIGFRLVKDEPQMSS